MAGMMLGLKGIDLAELTNKELKFLVREFCRKRIVEGYHKDEVVILAKREFSEVTSGDSPRIQPGTIHQWVTILFRDVTEAETNNKDNFGKNLSIAQQRLHHMYNLCIRKGDEKTALRVLQELHTLQGLSDGKIVLNFGFQQNNFQGNGNGNGQPAGHVSGSVPQYTQFSHLSDEELKQKALPHHQPPPSFDVLKQIKDVQEKTGEVIYVQGTEVDQLIEAHNKQLEK